jgi:tRNA(Ile)-lysidine synthase TilS/MesJ
MLEINKEDNKKLNNISKKFKKAINDYLLIENDDHILIGLSGGKDSLALVELLGERMKIFVPKFKLTAVHISVDNISYQSDLDYLKNFTAQFDIPFVPERRSDRRRSCMLPAQGSPRQDVVRARPMSEKNG